MNLEILKEALEASHSLIYEELECVELDELKEDYMNVIKKIEIALSELKQNG